MDITLLVKETVALLAPMLPYLVKAGDKALEAAGEKVGEKAWAWGERLWEKVKPKAEDRPVLKAALAEAAEAPLDLKAREALRQQLKTVFDEDESLAQQLARLLQDAKADGVTIVAAGQRSVAAQEIRDSAVVTGDGNTVVQQRGSGAIAIGSRPIAAGAGSAAVGGNLIEAEQVIIYNPPPQPEASVAQPAAVPEPKIVPRGLRSFEPKDHVWFLRLVPGTREASGLPTLIEDWVETLREGDPDRTFKVGLIYGPSGCGKSSLVKAGLMPALERAADSVLAIRVEATPDATEVSLLRELRKRVNGLPTDASLPEAIKFAQRHVEPLGSRKIVFLIDQFEQWLSARHGAQRHELIGTLRQCDGGRFQTVLLVREEFEAAVERLFETLGLRGHAKAGFRLDLFDRAHARKVLAEYGRGYDCLPEDLSKLSPTQEKFLDEVLDGLAEPDETWNSAKLALVSQMLKHEQTRWEAGAFVEKGGATGLGVKFLERRFPPRNRLRKMARRVLESLLPKAGTDIRGHSRGLAELRDDAGAAEAPAEFEDLIQVLDRELLLITLVGEAESARHDSPPERLGEAVEEPRYQLTHDYLVQAVREWLNHDQPKTARDWATRLLEQRAAEWRPTKQGRFLPSPLEYLRILLLADKTAVTQSQREFLRATHWFYARAGGAVMLGVFVIAAALGLWYRRGSEQDRAQARVEALLGASPEREARAIIELRPLQARAVPLLRSGFSQAEPRSGIQLKVALGLAAFGDLAPLQDMCRLDPNPTPRTAFIHGYHLWSSDPLRLVEVLRSIAAGAETNFRSALCAAFALVDWTNLAAADQETLRRTMQQIYTDAPDGGSHSAALCALIRWQQPLPTNAVMLRPLRQPPADRGWFVNGQGMTMVKVPAGSFRMGSDKGQIAEKEIHQVVMGKPLWISDREVTVGLFRKFMEHPDYPDTLKPKDWPGEVKDYSPTNDSPVQQVNWYDAVQCCNWLSHQEDRKPCYTNVMDRGTNVWRCDFKANGYRLPTEAEWEYACRAVSETEYAFGDDAKLVGDYAWFIENSRNQTWPAGTKLPNGWGLFDMHGNVYEWCWDWFAGYEPGKKVDPPGPESGQTRVLRGGSWDGARTGVRCANRGWGDPGDRLTGGGFRVVVSPF